MLQAKFFMLSQNGGGGFADYAQSSRHNILNVKVVRVGERLPGFSAQSLDYATRGHNNIIEPFDNPLD